jgi:hypothetical protein
MPLIWQMSSGTPFSLIRYLLCSYPHFFANLPCRLFILCPKSKRCWLSSKSTSQKISLKYCFSTVEPPNPNLITYLSKIGQFYYRQTVGIPQGSVLSSILCSFFYGDLEKTFSRFTKDPQSVCPTPVIVLASVLTTVQALLRLIDDYLFVTTSRKLAVDFLETMKKG